MFCINSEKTSQSKTRHWLVSSETLRKILKNMNMNTNITLSKEQMSLEFIKCKNNFLYFLHNYIVIPEVGSSVLYTPDLINPKFKRTVQIALKHGRVILLATRQIGKSTLAAAILEYLLNFYPNNRAIILNFSKTSGLENISKIRFIHNHLPIFLASPYKQRAVERLTYIEYQNGSKVSVFYPSSATSADTLARSLSSPILYVDECAFIRNMADAWASAAPVLAKAKEQAIKNNYKSLLMISSTPNGVEGVGGFFHSMCNNAIQSDEIFSEDNKLIPEYEQILNNPSRNGFVQVSCHWSELPKLGQEWYLSQCQNLNFDKRKIKMVFLKFFEFGEHPIRLSCGQYRAKSYN